MKGKVRDLYHYCHQPEIAAVDPRTECNIGCGPFHDVWLPSWEDWLRYTFWCGSRLSRPCTCPKLRHDKPHPNPASLSWDFVWYNCDWHQCLPCRNRLCSTCSYWPARVSCRNRWITQTNPPMYNSKMWKPFFKVIDHFSISLCTCLLDQILVDFV